MKTNNIIVLCIFLNFFNLSQSQVRVSNFELWNKHIEPLYYSISKSTQEASKKHFELLRPGKWIPKQVDISKPTVFAIALGKQPQPGQRIDIYTIPQGKTLYTRVGLPPEKEKFKEIIKDLFKRASIESDGYIFGPQVGPLLGFKGITERGYPLKDNFSKKDITKTSIIYTP